MIKFFLIFLVLFLTNNCSFDQRSGIWTQNERLDKSDAKVKILFEKEETISKELNPNFIIDTPLKIFENRFSYGTNDFGALNFRLNLKKILRFKFSKIKDFNYFDPTLGFDKKDIIFFDKKGSILKFDNKSKIIWKKNHYTKLEKKIFPILNFSVKKNVLVVTDNLSKYYAIDVNTGKILWSENHNTNFVSHIKIDGDRFYIIDANNIIYCFSLLDGSKIWEYRTDYELITSQKKLSIIFDEEKIYFINSKGDLYSLNKKNGNLLWITPTKNPDEIFQTFLLQTSQIVLNNDNLYFSNNMNNFFSIDKNSGFVNWKQNINSELKPIVVDELIFTVSADGFFLIIDKISGNILRINDVFNSFSNRKRKKITPTGFVLDLNNIYISMNNGKILMVNLGNGKIQSILKISNDKISKPFVNGNNMFVVKDNEIIRIN